MRAEVNQTDFRVSQSDAPGDAASEQIDKTLCIAIIY